MLRPILYEYVRYGEMWDCSCWEFCLCSLPSLHLEPRAIRMECYKSIYLCRSNFIRYWIIPIQFGSLFGFDLRLWSINFFNAIFLIEKRLLISRSGETYVFWILVDLCLFASSSKKRNLKNNDSSIFYVLSYGNVRFYISPYKSLLICVSKRSYNHLRFNSQRLWNNFANQSFTIQILYISTFFIANTEPLALTH